MLRAFKDNGTHALCLYEAYLEMCLEFVNLMMIAHSNDEWLHGTSDKG